MKLDNFFDKIYVINLKRRADRLEKFFQGIAPYVTTAQSIEVVEAVDGLAERPDLGSSAGKWGCTASHIKIHDLILERGHKKILIFEDDCDFFESFEEIFSRSVEDLPDDWDMFYLGSNPLVRPQQVKNRVHRLNKAYAIMACAVTKGFIEKNHKLLREWVVAHAGHPAMNMDVRYSEIHQAINAYCVYPSICGMFASYSDLENREVDYSVFRNQS